MKKSTYMAAGIVALAALAALIAAPVTHADHHEKANPLAKFEPYLGAWEHDNSYQVFEWGVGKTMIKAYSYVMTEGEPKLVSEGLWYYHPKEKAIVGAFTAIEMPFTVIDYKVRFLGKRLIAELVAYDANGGETLYTEQWVPGENGDTYEWKLLNGHGADAPEMMAVTFTRKVE